MNFKAIRASAYWNILFILFVELLSLNNIGESTEKEEALMMLVICIKFASLMLQTLFRTLVAEIAENLVKITFLWPWESF